MANLGAEVRARVAGRAYGGALVFLPSVDSTMDEARRLLREGAAPGTVVLAERQTAGRGRLGRTFVSPPGGLYLTLLLAPPGDPADGWRCGFAAALAARDAIRAAGGPEVEFDWPNDLVLGPRKVGGILLELILPAGRAPALLLGVGLNLGPDPAASDPAAAGPAGPVPFPAGDDPRAEVAAGLLAGLEALVPLCADEAGWGSVLDAVRAFSRAARGAPVSVRTADGGELSGRGVGLRADGALLLRLPDGTLHAVRYGERVYDTGPCS